MGGHAILSDEREESKEGGALDIKRGNTLEEREVGMGMGRRRRKTGFLG